MRKHRWSNYRIWARLEQLGVIEYDLARVCPDCRRHEHVEVTGLPLTDDGRINFLGVFGSQDEYAGECGPRV